MLRIRGMVDSVTILAGDGVASGSVAVGRVDEAASIWMEMSLHNSVDRIFDIRLAALLVWYGKTNEHAAMSTRLLETCKQTQEAGDANCVAKLASIRPLADAKLRQAALDLARRAVELGQKDIYLPWFLLSVGMAEYRMGHFGEADLALLRAEQSAEEPSHMHRSWIQCTARYYHSMTLFQLGRLKEARLRFAEAQAPMKRPLSDGTVPTTGGANHDDLVLWLARKEAEALLATAGLSQKHRAPSILVHNGSKRRSPNAPRARSTRTT